MTAGRILHRRTPYTRFELASLLQPTVFKTAPSPPGHTAFLHALINHRLFTQRALALHNSLCLTSDVRCSRSSPPLLHSSAHSIFKSKSLPKLRFAWVYQVIGVPCNIVTSSYGGVSNPTIPGCLSVAFPVMLS